METTVTLELIAYLASLKVSQTPITLVDNCNQLLYQHRVDQLKIRNENLIILLKTKAGVREQTLPINEISTVSLVYKTPNKRLSTRITFKTLQEFDEYLSEKQNRHLVSPRNVINFTIQTKLLRNY